MLRNLGVLALAVALAVVGGAAGSGVYGGKDGKDPDVFTTLVWREQLGRHAWFYLHTLAATYPDAPTEEDKQAVRNLMASFGQLFPCKLCRRHLQGNLGPTHGVGPVAVGSREELSLWMCKLHNTVNTQNGKPEQPCELAQLDALYRKDDVDDGKAPEPKVPWDAALYVKDPAEYQVVKPDDSELYETADVNELLAMGIEYNVLTPKKEKKMRESLQAGKVPEATMVQELQELLRPVFKLKAQLRALELSAKDNHVSKLESDLGVAL